MKKVIRVFTLVSLVISTVLASRIVQADIKLPRLISDGLILQRDKPIKMWGWADDGETVTIQFAGKTLSTETKNGRWQLTFPPLAVGGPYRLKIEGKNTLEINDILIGDVWIVAGQSNMELTINRVKSRYPGLIEKTYLPKIRAFNVPRAYDFKAPQEDFKEGQWKTATPEHLATFSAAGFFFARQLNEKYHVPIGLVTIAVGGSPAQAWMSESALEKYPHYLAQSLPFKNDTFLSETIMKEKMASEAWTANLKKNDIGIANRWSNGAPQENDWIAFTMPGHLKDQGSKFVRGSVWFRKNFTLTEQQAAKATTLSLGAIVDDDITYLNGKEIGQNSSLYNMRRYSIPAGLLKAGINTISIRVVARGGDAGFVKDKSYALELVAGTISLEGDWEYKVAATAEIKPESTTLWYQPYTLFNALLSPCLNLGIKGAIWYQGESNVGKAGEYHDLFPDMIYHWRNEFKQGDFPFLFVQLANYKIEKSEPSESMWAETREAQRKTLKVKNTGMAVAIDVGEWNDIHPLNKKTVGERLALQAQKLAYNDNKLIASGPNAIAVERQSNALIISFDEEGGQLATPTGGAVHQITIAGADKKYVWAKAKIENDRLLVWSDQIQDPVSVRYAWADNPQGANLFNTMGLPASPFELKLK